MNDSNASRLTRTLLSATFLALLTLAPSAAQAFCGDDIIETDEECDDGNNLDGDCCAADCTAEQVESPCTDNNECTFDLCDGQGNCSSFPNQGECDDGNPCTIGDFCNVDGFCANDGTQEDGSTCTDENLCGSIGFCSGGFCAGDPADCDGIGDVCNSAVCDPQQLRCIVTPLDDDTPCDNPNVCTDPGTCQSGECEQPPRDCSAFADECNDAFCDVEARGCFSLPKENGTACDDTSSCTDPGTCDDGECLTEPKDCSSFADQCNDADCDPQTENGCFASPKEDGTGCSDGDLCTTTDQCTAGECGGTPVDCSEFGDDCNSAFCDGQTGECDTTPVEGPAACDDGNPCTTNDQCDAGICAGEPVDCSKEDTACTVGVCSLRSGQCEALPREDGLECDDGDQCTTGDQCNKGSCGGTPLDCSGSGDQCNTGFCNGDTGGCESVPVEEPAPCDDVNLCTTGDTCSDGECIGTPTDCSVFDGECVTGRCNEENGVCFGEPFEDGTSCDDGLLCTTVDVCGDGTCGGTEKDCSASGGNCLVGECNPDTGQCVGEPAEDGTSCSDGDNCTQEDVCSGGECLGDPITCKPSLEPCEETFCNAANGLCESRDADEGTPCDDGAFCTATDTCTAGVCGGTGNPCSGSLVCDGQCNEDTDSCIAPSGTPCESDGNPCTDELCNGDGGCVATANDENACDDGLFCTSGDHCVDSFCVGEATCPQTSVCGDTCDEAADACRTCGHPFSNERCIVNAIFVLQGALGLRECELCTCDVDSSGDVVATDALLVLRTCVALPTQLECPSGEETTTTTSTSISTTSSTTITTTSSSTTTTEGGCEAELHNAVFIEKYTCAQSFTDAEPFCADLNEQDTIQFTHISDGAYQVRDVPDSGFIINGLYDCSTFTWSGGSPGEYSEGGFWTFSQDKTSFSGSSVYAADNGTYAGGCNETGAEAPTVPPDPEPIPPCE